jgi:hypothetical protein
MWGTERPTGYFCGKTVEPPLSYCAEHANRAFLPNKDFPRRKIKPETAARPKEESNGSD